MKRENVCLVGFLIYLILVFFGGYYDFSGGKVFGYWDIYESVTDCIVSFAMGYYYMFIRIKYKKTRQTR